MKDKDKILEDQAWAQMEHLLDLELPQKRKRRSAVIWWIGLCLLVAGSISALYLMGSFQSIEAQNENGNAIPILAKSNSVDSNLMTQNEGDDQKNMDDADDIIPMKKVKSDKNRSAVKETIGASVSSKSIDVKTNEITNAKSTYVASSTKLSTVNDVVEINEVVGVLNENKNQKFSNAASRAELKRRIASRYKESYGRDGFKKKKIELSGIQNGSEEIDLFDNESAFLVPTLTLLPSVDEKVNSLNKSMDYIVFDDAKVYLAKDKTSISTWHFGVFSSYKYLDKYFKGFDVGGLVEYRKEKYAIGFKLGYERIINTTEEVLVNAAVGVIATSPENILNNSKTAGFQLSDILLSRQNWISEITLAYSLPLGFSVSSGLGYKRLFRVNTRSISAVDPGDQMSFGDIDSFADFERLSNSSVLDDPTVDRNQFYIPIEFRYNPLRNIQIGLGTQLFLNTSFNEFQETNRSIYGRVSYRF